MNKKTLENRGDSGDRLDHQFISFPLPSFLSPLLRAVLLQGSLIHSRRRQLSRQRPRQRPRQRRRQRPRQELRRRTRITRHVLLFDLFNSLPAGSASFASCRRDLRLLLGLHPPVLKPYLDLPLREAEGMGDLDPPPPRQVPVVVEFLLEF